MEKDIGIYIHIPFCKSKCYYCDFCSKSIDIDKEDEIISKYIDAVCMEILNNAELLSERKISSIYFGGGTPSYINEKYIARIMKLLLNFIPTSEDNVYDIVNSGSSITINNNIECTIELNPADITEKKLKSYIELGFNRFSLGIQSINDESLKKIGRRHSKKEVDLALDCIKNAGITNVSLDIITGLPGENESVFENTLEYVLSLKNKNIVKHISIYSLEVHESTKLGFLISENILSLPDEDTERNMKHSADNILIKNGFEMYEISNYAIKGYESKHNLNYWNCGEYLGLGVAAASHINSTRYTNIDNISEYINRINNNISLIAEKEELDKLASMKEHIILGLRLNKGVSFKKFRETFNVEINSLFKTEIDKNISDGLLEYTNNKDSNDLNIHLTARGRDLANLVWQSFI